MDTANNPFLDRRSFLGLAVTAGAGLVLGNVLTGCTAPSSSETPVPAAEQEETAPAASDIPAPQPGRALVAVFSWSGNTMQVANRIHELVESDLFVIEPAEPYTSDYNALLDIAQNEQREGYLPPLAATVENWDQYDRVFLGYPVWWSHIPQVVASFIAEHDLTGKTVLPFATSGGSGIATTISDIRAACPGANIGEGLLLSGSSVASSLDQVDAWLAEAGLR